LQSARLECRVAELGSLDDKGAAYVNVLFDLDGTLTDPKAGIVACIKHALSTLRRPIPEESELERLIGPPLRDSFSELLSGTEDVELAVDAYRDRFRTLGMYENTVYEGIPEALDSLRSRGAQLFVVTSKPKKFAVSILQHFRLSDYFTAIYGSELDGRLSDKGDLIAHALAASRLRATDTVMVGDRRHDVRGSLTNDVFPAGVLWGYGSREELTCAGARALYEAPIDLEQIVV